MKKQLKSKRTFENKQQYDENILKDLVLLLSGGKIRSMINKNIRSYNEDPEVQATLKSIQYWHDKLKNDMKTLCQRSPGLDICKKETQSKILR